MLDRIKDAARRLRRLRFAQSLIRSARAGATRTSLVSGVVRIETRRFVMLRVKAMFMKVLPRLMPMVRMIEGRDAGLADQLRRAAASVVLNQAEGYASHRGNRMRHFRYAYASLKETQAALQVAAVMGYIEELDGKLVDELDHLAAASWRLMHPR